jgi:hypothetical protein
MVTTHKIHQQLLQPRAVHAAVVLAAWAGFTSLGCNKPMTARASF